MGQCCYFLNPCVYKKLIKRMYSLIKDILVVADLPGLGTQPTPPVSEAETVAGRRMEHRCESPIGGQQGLVLVDGQHRGSCGGRTVGLKRPAYPQKLQIRPGSTVSRLHHGIPKNRKKKTLSGTTSPLLSLF